MITRETGSGDHLVDGGDDQMSTVELALGERPVEPVAQTTILDRDQHVRPPFHDLLPTAARASKVSSCTTSTGG